MPPPQLKYDAVQTLLEQKLRCREGFAEILAVNNVFLEIGNDRKIYQLRFIPWAFDRISSWFTCQNVWTKTSTLTFEKMRKILSLLRPSLDIKSYSGCKLPTSSLLELMQVGGGKVHFGINSFHHNGLFILGHLWQHLDELSCDAKLLAQINRVRSKKFNKLRVWGIENSDHLHAVLRQKSDRLELDFRGEYVHGIGEQGMANNAEQCLLDFKFMKMDEISAAVKDVLASFTRLKRLEIEYAKYLHNTTFEQFIEELRQYHKFYVQITKMVREMRPNLLFDMSFNLKHVSGFMEIPQNWRQRIKNCVTFKNVQILAIQDCCTFVTASMASNDNLTNTHFSFQFHSYNPTNMQEDA